MHERHSVLLRKLLSRTVFDGTCRIWQGALNSDGYGNMSIPVWLREEFGHKYGKVHRVVFFLSTGVIAKELMHTCDRPPCLEMAHLVNGTHKENMHDSMDKGRFPRGSTNGTSRLTEADVQEIRQALAEARASWSGKYLPRGIFPALARRYNVSVYCIRSVHVGEAWRWLAP